MTDFFTVAFTGYILSAFGLVVAGLILYFLFIMLSGRSSQHTYGLSKHFRPNRNKIYSDLIPFDDIAAGDNRFIIARGHVIGVLKLDGLDLSSKKLEEKNTLLLSRQRALLDLEGHDIQTRLIIKRSKVDFATSILSQKPDDYKGLTDYSFVMAMVKRWIGQFKDAYKNSNYLIISCPVGKNSEGILKLENILKKATNKLAEYRPEILKIAQPGRDSQSLGLLEFWSGLINPLMNFKVTPPELDILDRDNRLASYLVGCVPLTEGKTQSGHIYEKDGYLVFIRGSKEVWMAGMGISKWGPQTSGELWTHLMTMDEEIWLTQWISVLNSARSLGVLKARIQDEERAHVTGAFINQSKKLEFARINNLLTDSGSEERLVYHQAAMLMLADTKEELDNKISVLENLADDVNVSVLRFGKEIKSIYLSMFPPHLSWTHKTLMKGENIATLFSLIDTPVGIVKSDYGNRPVTVYRTVLGSPYAFSFHAREGERASGNVGIFAPNDSGKTVLTNHLVGSSLGFPDLRVYQLDRMQGSYVPITAMGGLYYPIFSDMASNVSIELNPLQIEGATLIRPEDGRQPHPNALFVRDWILKSVCGLSDNDKEAYDELERALSGLNLTPLHQRNLGEVLAAVSKNGILYSSLERWASKDKADSRYFNGSKDTLDVTSNRLIAFDVSRVDQSLFGRFIPYLFHRILTANRSQNSPFIMIAEEIGGYLKDPTFAGEYARALEEWRKNRGSMVSVFQHPGQINGIANSSVKQAIKTQIKKFIVFPSPTWNAQDFKELGFDDNEIDIITYRSPLARKMRGVRWAFLKIVGEGHVILDIDMQPLGNLFKIFEASGEGPAMKARALQENFGADWVREMVGEDIRP